MHLMLPWQGSHFVFSILVSTHYYSQHQKMSYFIIIFLNYYCFSFYSALIYSPQSLSWEYLEKRIFQVRKMASDIVRGIRKQRMMKEGDGKRLQQFSGVSLPNLRKASDPKGKHSKNAI